jgi:photosystem II stability/assembly factor-like uncharacterized protein
MRIKRSYIGVMWLLLSVAGCYKESYVNHVTPLTQANKYNINDLERIDTNTLIAAGGRRYELGVVLLSSNNGATWQQIATPLDKTIFAVDFIDNMTGVAACLDGKILKTLDGGYNWTVHQSYWADVYDVDISPDSVVVACGGMGTDRGIVWHSGDWCNTIMVDTSFLHSFRVIKNTKPEHWIVAGYGFAARSTDNGLHWQRIDEVKGDYYFDIAQTNPETLYMVGFEGTILKSTDGGASWDKSLDGNRFFSERIHINAIRFYDDNNGVAACNKGIVLTTKNAGDTWQLQRIGSTNDLHTALYIDASTILVAGEQGMIYRVE